MEAPQRLVDHFFRREYGRLVALLTRTLGFKNLDLVEDVVQSALAQALQSWSLRGIPEDPAGWLYRVAKNAAIDSLRRDRRWVLWTAGTVFAALLACYWIGDEIYPGVSAPH